MPSAEMSCILQQAETILIANWSTTRTRQSTSLAFFFCVFCFMASFIISATKRHFNKLLSSQVCNALSSNVYLSVHNAVDVTSRPETQKLR